MLTSVVVLSFVLAFIIGSNDVIGSLGTSYGARIMSLRKSLILVVIFKLVGIVLLGHLVMSTVGTGIATNLLPVPIALASVCMAMVVIYFKMPVSMTHVIVGALVGSSMAAGNAIMWSKMNLIFLAWIISPVMALCLAGISYLLFLKLYVKRTVRLSQRVRVRKAFIYLQIFMGCLIAIAMGANNVGLVVGFDWGHDNIYMLEIIGAVGISLGILTWGSRIMKYVGRGLTHLTPTKGFFAQLAGAYTMLFFILQGIPIAPTSIMVAGMMGVGIATHGINRRMMVDILLMWMITFPVSVVLGYGITYMFLSG